MVIKAKKMLELIRGIVSGGLFSFSIEVAG